MEQEMRVSKHTTIKGDDDTETYKVMLKFSSAEATARTRIRKVILDSEDPKVFEQYPLNELVSLRIVKPQKRLA